MPPLGIEVSPRFKSEARSLSADQFDQLDEPLHLLAATFGQPHRQAGLGIRRLREDHFEFRFGRDTRVVFRLKDSTAILRMIGNHDDVRRFLKNV